MTCTESGKNMYKDSEMRGSVRNTSSGKKTGEEIMREPGHTLSQDRRRVDKVKQDLVRPVENPRSLGRFSKGMDHDRISLRRGQSACSAERFGGQPRGQTTD